MKPIQPKYKNKMSSIKSEVMVHKQGEPSRFLTDDIAVEVPVALVYNYISHAVMMATPENLEEFAIGFSITEEIVNCRDDITHIHIHHGQDGMTVRLQISDDCYDKLKEKRRNLVGRTGCGLCGTETLKQAVRPTRQVEAPAISEQAIIGALKELKDKQALQLITGATHAVAWCDLQGKILLVREDVGRHNALDKVIGVLASSDTDTMTGFIVVTSRASYEMVQKCNRVGIGCLVAISAPTSLAIELSQQANLLLIGFARNQRYVIYNDPNEYYQQQAHLALQGQI
jgi:FdhD protein